MARVSLTKHLQRFCDATDADVAGTTVREVLDAYLVDQPSVRPYLLDEHDRIRRHVVVFLNDRQLLDRADLSEPMADDDTLHVMQALSGGCITPTPKDCP